MRQPRLALAAAAALVAVGALGSAVPAGGAEGSSNPHEVTASGTAFSPKRLAVKPGTEVTWTVVDEPEKSHEIVLDDPKADCSDDDDCDEKNRSGYLGDGISFRREFEKVGDYPYSCTVVTGMTGIVYVNETGTVPSTAPPPPPPTTAPPTTQPPPTSPPATAPPTTAPRPTSPPPTAPPPAPTTTTKPPKAGAAGKVKAPKPPKTTTTEPEADSTTTTVPPPVLPPLAERGPLVQVPASDSTTTTLLPGEESGDDGFVAINKGSRRGGVKKMTYAAVGALGLSLLGGGIFWWRSRPSRYWTA